jgi:tRNA modification GTPase
VAEAAEALARAQAAGLPELAAEDLRLALRALGRVVGTVDVEDLLDLIFHDFCIGK